MLISNQGLKAVCIFDPAIAPIVPNDVMLDYAKTRRFELIAPYIKGTEPPTIYQYRHLSRSIMDRYVDVQSSDEAKAAAGFQYGVTSVLNMRTEDGARINWEPSGETTTPDGKIRTLTDKECDLFSRAEQVEIGTVIYNAAFLPRWIERGYLVPPLSLSLWARQERPLAVESQSTVAPSSEKPSAQASQQKAQTDQGSGRSGGAFAPATAATAQGKDG